MAAILFLCSKEARWITGLIMPVDAGVSPTVSHRPHGADSLYSGSHVEYHRQQQLLLAGRPC